jgi:hypothetical protein
MTGVDVPTKNVAVTEDTMIDETAIVVVAVEVTVVGLMAAVEEVTTGSGAGKIMEKEGEAEVQGETVVVVMTGN